MKNLDIYCVTNKKLDYLEKTSLKLVGVGQEKFPENYIKCDTKENIFYKEKYYSELTFHYWYWKNILPYEKNDWVGFCQKRRFWVKKEYDEKTIFKDNLDEFLLDSIEEKLNIYESFICKPIKVSGAKKIKILKRGWRNLIKDPSILYNSNKETLVLHFDMHHGYGNLQKAILQMDKSDRDEFYNFVKFNSEFNPHIMYISKKSSKSIKYDFSIFVSEIFKTFN